MKIVRVSAIPMSAPVPKEKRHRTDLGTKVKSDATLIRVETDNGLTGIGAALGTPPIVAAIVEHELAPEVVGEDPMFSERIYEKMYNGSRSRPALERGVTQADESRRRGVIMEAIAGVACGRPASVKKESTRLLSGMGACTTTHPRRLRSPSDRHPAQWDAPSRGPSRQLSTATHAPAKI